MLSCVGYSVVVLNVSDHGYRTVGNVDSRIAHPHVDQVYVHNNGTLFLSFRGIMCSIAMVAICFTVALRVWMSASFRLNYAWHSFTCHGIIGSSIFVACFQLILVSTLFSFVVWSCLFAYPLCPSSVHMASPNSSHHS